MGNKFLSTPLSPGIPYLPDHLGPLRPECPPTSDHLAKHGLPCGLLSLCSSFRTLQVPLDHPHQSRHLPLDVPCLVLLPGLCSLSLLT